MNKDKILSKLQRLYAVSEKINPADNTAISKWASEVDPLLESINQMYVVMFRAYRADRFYDSISRSWKYKFEPMREQVMNGIKALENTLIYLTILKSNIIQKTLSSMFLLVSPIKFNQQNNQFGS